MFSWQILFSEVKNTLPFLFNNNDKILLFSIEGIVLNDKVLFEYNGDLNISSVMVVDWYENEVVANLVLLPKEHSLSPSYPNPFNPVTTIEYAIPSENLVSIQVYDFMGRNITTLFNDIQGPGYHSIIWDASSYASGIYFVKMVQIQLNLPLQ